MHRQPSFTLYLKQTRYNRVGKLGDGDREDATRANLQSGGVWGVRDRLLLFVTGFIMAATAPQHIRTMRVYLGGNVCQRKRQGRRRITGKYRHRVGVHAIARDGHRWHAAAHV